MLPLHYEAVGRAHNKFLQLILHLLWWEKTKQHLNLTFLWSHRDSNSGPSECKSDALPNWAMTPLKQFQPYCELGVISSLYRPSRRQRRSKVIFHTTITHLKYSTSCAIRILFSWVYVPHRTNPIECLKIFVSPNRHPLGISFALKRFNACITVIPTVYRLWPHLYKFPL